jgi:DNA-binding IclR family transcriptional regulator
VILAYLPPRILKKSYARHRDEIVGLGATWEEFKVALKAIRKQGYCVTRGDVDEDLVGIAAPVMNAEQRIVGSLSIVGTADSMQQVSMQTLIALVRAAAEETRERIAALEASMHPTLPRAMG